MKPEEIEVGGWYWFEWGISDVYLGQVLSKGANHVVFSPHEFYTSGKILKEYREIIGPGEPPEKDQTKLGYFQRLWNALWGVG